MTTDQHIPELDKRGLQRFGLVTGSIVCLLFGLLFPWLFARPWPLWPWILLWLLGALALIAPVALRPIYITWMKFGLIAGKVTTPLILGVIFFFVIFPTALVRKLFGHDSMARAFEPNASTYRVPSTKHPADNLEKPF